MRYEAESKHMLELVEFFDNAILQRAYNKRLFELELVEFFDNAIFHRANNYICDTAGACRVF